MNDDLLSYVLNLSEPDERQRLEKRLQTEPELQRQVDAWRRLAAPLAADREDPEPLPGLAERTIEFVTLQASRSGQATELRENISDLPAERLQALVEILDRRAMTAQSRWRRWDVAAVACMLVIFAGLVFATIPFVRQQQERIACQNQLRELHRGLEIYSDIHEGQYPQVREEPPFNTAAAVAPLLQEAGAVPSNLSFACPASVMMPATYAYTLGYREPTGQLVGLEKHSISEKDNLPILADRPITRTGNGVSPEHRYGQNVLFMAGHVRFCTTTKVGIGGDEIYINQFGRVAAGLHHRDTVLGFGGDQP